MTNEEYAEHQALLNRLAQLERDVREIADCLYYMQDTDEQGRTSFYLSERLRTLAAQNNHTDAV